MGRGKSFDHKKKGHPGDFKKDTLVEGKNHIQYGKPIENIIPEETLENSVNEEE